MMGGFQKKNIVPIHIPHVTKLQRLGIQKHKDMHQVKLISLLSLCIWMSANAQTPYDSFAPGTSRPILTSEALSREICAQDFSLDTTLLVAMINTQQERILLVDMSNGSIVAYAPLTDNKSHWLSPDPLQDKYPEISPYAYCHWNPMPVSQLTSTCQPLDQLADRG